MKPIIGYFRQHLQEDFHPLGYALTAGFIGLLIWVNYGLIPGKSLEVVWISSVYGTELAMLRYLIWYSVPYLGTILIWTLIRQEQQLWRNPQFWLRAGFGLLLLSIDGGFYYHRVVVAEFQDPMTRYIWTKWLVNFNSTLAMGIPLLIFWWVWDRKDSVLYGLQLKGVDARPYFVLLLLMVPVVAMASFGEDFIQYYPTLKPEAAARWPNLPTWLTMLIFEGFYLSDFLWTELIFRGFFVIGMAKVLGKGAVLPMVSMYAVRHFAKPVLETVGSVFGGYILGVIAFRSKNIWGGVLIHVGIALLMDVCALIQRGYF